MNKHKHKYEWLNVGVLNNDVVLKLLGVEHFKNSKWIKLADFVFLVRMKVKGVVENRWQ